MAREIILRKKKYNTEEIKEMFQDQATNINVYTKQEWDEPMSRDAVAKAIKQSKIEAKWEGFMGSTSLWGALIAGGLASTLGMVTVTVSFWAGAPFLVGGLIMLFIGLYYLMRR